MKRILTYFFVTLGIIFFVLLLVLGYLWFADPFGVRPLIDSFSQPMSVTTQTTDTGTENNTTDKHPKLSEEQEQALESIGINPETLPTTITPEMEVCFTAKLGETRVREIQEGSTPTAVEIFKTRECY